MKHPNTKIRVGYFLIALLPLYAHAHMVSTVDATADSGGNSAASGVSITIGSTSASVDVETVVGSESSSTIQVETVTNGSAHHETYNAHGSTAVGVVASSSRHQIRLRLQGSTAPQHAQITEGKYSFFANIAHWFMYLFH